MGGTCSMQRQRSNRRHEERANSERHPRASSDAHSSRAPPRRSLRHSVVSTYPDGCISALYPTGDNYVNAASGRRSPKSLAELCTETICRSLPRLDGELPPGLPIDVVDDIVESLVRHSALNATTLRILKNCELGSLRLAGCRGVTDAWLEPFTNAETVEQPEHLKSMELDYFGTFEAQHDAKSTASSRSTSSFVSANSNLEESVPDHGAAFLPDAPMEDVVVMEDAMTSYNSLCHHGPANASLTLLDLRGSQRLTDKGLLQLSALPVLEVAKLDNCHSIVGKGLLALGMSQRLHTLSLTNCRRLTDEAIVNISHLVSLRALSLDGCRCLTDRSLQAISEFGRLQKLDLSQCDLLTDSGLEHLDGLESLEELSLGWCRSITNRGLDILSVQPGRSQMLRILRLARCVITDDGVEFLGRLLALTELDLNGCSNIGSPALGRVLELMPNLNTLDVSYIPGILRTSWQGKIQNLKSLDLCYAGVKDSHLSRLVDLPALESLNLDSCPIGDWAISHLSDNVVPNLKSLELADTDLTDLAASHLPKFRHLTRLSLFYCNITNAGLRHIAELAELEVLNLDSREISDLGCSHLRNLQKLRCLDLFSGRITDSGCAHISRIKSLESLELCGGGVGDLGCTLISGLENLTSLNLSQNDRITNRGASALATLKNLRALNLSNTAVNPSAHLRLPKSLQSLALYGCRGIDDGNGMLLLQTDLPSLKCLRLNSQQNEDGMMVGIEIDDAFDALDSLPTRADGPENHSSMHVQGMEGEGRDSDVENNSMVDGADDESFYSDHD